MEPISSLSARIVIVVFGGFFVFLYSKLKDILGHLLPQNLIESSVELPPQGSEIKLSNYGLNERQISILKEMFEIPFNFVTSR